MTKHLSFWIGFFAAALLVVPIAAGIMGAAEQELRQVAVILFAGAAVLVVGLVLVLFFRDWILRRVLGRTQVALEDVAGSLIASVAAASAGDRAKAADQAQAFVQHGVGWYAWSSFYRWVIATAVALLLAFGAFMGTVLLFEQNRKLGEQTEVLEKQSQTLDRQTEALEVQTERLTEQTGFMQAQTELMQAQTERLREQTEAATLQNEIMALNMVNQLREQMVASASERPLGDWLKSIGLANIDQPLVTFAEGDRACALGFDLTHPLTSLPSPATLGAIVDLARNPVLGERIITALDWLTADRNGAVALGALKVLDVLDQPFGRKEFPVSNVMIEERFRLRTASYNLNFTGSFVTNLSCSDCNVIAERSIYMSSGRESWSSRWSFIFDGRSGRYPPFTLLTRSPREQHNYPDSWQQLDRGPAMSFTDALVGMKIGPNETACDVMAELALRNPLLKTMAP